MMNKMSGCGCGSKSAKETERTRKACPMPEKESTDKTQTAKKADKCCKTTAEK